MIYARKTVFILFALMLLTIVNPAYPAEDGLDLRLNPERGKSYELEISVEQQISQKSGDNLQELTQSLNMKYTFEKIDIDDEGYMNLKVIYNLLSFKQDGWMGKIDYDAASVSENTHPMTRLLSAANSMSFNVKLSASGKVKSVDGNDALISKVLDKIDVKEERERILMKGLLDDHFGEKAIKELIENKIFWYFPDKKIQKGDTWDKKIVMSDRYPMVIKSICTLRDIKDRECIIDVISHIGQNPEPVISPVDERRYFLAGNQSGELRIDEGSGWLKHGKLLQEFSGNVHIENNKDKTRSASFSVSVKKTIEFDG